MSKLKAMRESKGLSQKELSKETGIRQATISEIETGKAKDTWISTYKKLAEYFKCTIDELVD